MTDEVKRCVEALRMCDLPKNVQPVAFYVCRDCLAYEPDVACRINLTAADLIEALVAELEQVKRERDEMFDILSDVRNCADCKYLRYSFGEEPCRTCLENTNTKVNWQWRGVKE